MFVRATRDDRSARELVANFAIDERRPVIELGHDLPRDLLAAIENRPIGFDRQAHRFQLVIVDLKRTLVVMPFVVANLHAIVPSETPLGQGEVGVKGSEFVQLHVFLSQ